MLAVISSTADATVLTLVDISLVEPAIDVMLVVNCSAAAATVVDWLLISSAPPAICVAVAERPVEDADNWHALQAMS